MKTAYVAVIYLDHFFMHRTTDSIVSAASDLLPPLCLRCRSLSLIKLVWVHGLERQELGHSVAVGGLLITGREDGRTQGSGVVGVPNRRLPIRYRSHTEDGAAGFGYIGVEDEHGHAFLLSEPLRIQAPTACIGGRTVEGH